MDNNADEIDYDKLVEFELSCLNDEEIGLDNDDNDEFSSVLENDIVETDSVEITLEKISKAHEEFYKMCFENVQSNDDLINNENNSNSDKLTEKRNGILNSYNLTYDDFVRKVSEIENEFVNDIEKDEREKLSELALGDVSHAQSSIQTLFEHEKVINELNEENWDNYQKFYLEYSERCQSARSTSQKLLKEEAQVEKQRRQNLKVILDEQLKNLEMRMKDEELDNKVRLEEIEAEIQDERKLLVKLKTDSREMLILKNTWAAIMIQKHFRKYRIRKRIGSKIDEVRQNARRKLLNTKFIINEKLTQKQRANELRKWKKEKMLKEKSDKLEKETQLILISNDAEESFNEVCNIEGNDLGKQEELVSEQFSPENELNMIHDANENQENKFEDIIVEEIKEDKLNEEDLSIPVESSFEEHQLTENKNTDLKLNNEIEQNMVIVDETNVHKTEIRVTENTEEENPSLDNEYIEKNEIFNLLAMQTNNNNLDLNDPEEADREIKDVIKNSSHSIVCSDDDIKDTIIKEPANGNDEIERCIIYNENNDSTSKLVINNNVTIQDESSTLEKEEFINDEKKNDFSIKNDDHYESRNDDCVPLNVTNNNSKSTDENHDIRICRSSLSDLVNTEYINLRNDTIEDINSNMVVVIQSDGNKSEFSHDERNCEPEPEDMSRVTIDNNIERKLEQMDFREDKKVSMRDALTKSESENLLSDLSVNLQPNEKPSINLIKEEFLESVFKRNEKCLKLCVSWMKQNTEQGKQNSCTKEVTNRMERTIPSVPKHLNDSVNFTIENIDQNAIVTDPHCTSRASSKSLSITNSPLDCISNIKENFSNIEHLNVCHTSLASFHSTNAPDSLKYLNINKNKLEWAYFGSSVHSCLTILSCSSNDISDLPPAAFQNCNSILHIDFSNNNFISIENIFKGNEALNSLCSINLSNNVLSSIDNLDTYCPNLTHINLSNNHLKNWSNDYKFTYLIDCDLSHNSLISLESWMNTPIIVYLNLSHNSISSLESFVDSWMPCLVTLQLDSNKLKEIPDFPFLSLQNLSIQRNYLNDSVNFERLFQNAPLLSFINVKGNLESLASKIRIRDGKLVDNVGDITTQTPCPDGDFAAACFDFADSIQQKSLRFLKIFKSSSDSELIYKHQFHYYRCIREVAEDFYLWMCDFLFCSNSSTALHSEDKYSEIHNASAIKIQAFWKGYRTRRWYRSFISNIKYDIEKCFEELGPVDIVELDQMYLINKMNQIDEFPKPTSAWLENVKQPEYDIQKISRYKVAHQPENDELIISGNESTYRSNSSSLLNKKGMEIMKEWGFEDPRSAFWIMERAKKFQRKIDKNIKPLNTSNKRNISNISPKPPQYPTKVCISPDYKRPQDHPKHSSVQINTVTLQPPNTSQFSNYRSKIDEWLSESKFPQDIPATSDVDKKSFLPVIVDSENQVKKIPPTLIRPKSSSTKLPSIN